MFQSDWGYVVLNDHAMAQAVSSGRGFDSSSVRVTCVVDKVALGQACLQVLWFCPVSIIPQILLTYFRLEVALIWGTTRLGNAPKKNGLSEIGEHWIEKYLIALVQERRWEVLEGLSWLWISTEDGFFWACFCSIWETLRLIVLLLASQAGLHSWIHLWGADTSSQFWKIQSVTVSILSLREN
jgi:hypothetical protein